MTETQSSPPQDCAGPESFLLDTSAILAFYHDEDGAETVERVFEQRERGEAVIWVSFMTLFEIKYLTLGGHVDSDLLLFRLSTLDLDQVWPDDRIVQFAAEIKALGKISAADAFIAASAMDRSATLVHGDKEFLRLSQKVRQLTI